MTGALLFSMQYFVTEPTNSLDKIPILCRIRMTPAGLTSSTYLHIAAPMLLLSGVPTQSTSAITTDAPFEEAPIIEPALLVMLSQGGCMGKGIRDWKACHAGANV